MDANKTPNKKSLGMLIMILALVLVAVILVIVIVASSGGSDDTSPETTTEMNPTDTTDTTGGTDESTGTPDSTEAPDSSSTPETTTKAPDEPETPVVPVQPSTNVADETGKISVNSDGTGNGLLVKIDANNPYAYMVDQLFKGDHETKLTDVEAQGFFRITENADASLKFASIGNNHFLRQEALKAFAAMIAAFDAAAGTNKPFRVEGYTASHAETLTDSYVTGNVVMIRILEDGGTLPLNYSARKVELDGQSVTYDKWFAAKAAEYGFIFEGLIGGDSINAGRFRYVGTVHAAGIAAAGSLDAYLAGIKDGTVTTVTVGTETWNLSYTAASLEATTEITVGASATYLLSGDNMGGFIVAVKAA